uniref:Uncharacterized protein n=1 Tax=Anguilla anguilla TaxID=7936 RepID=A0A0E9UQC7_ANGAN
MITLYYGEPEFYIMLIQ